LRFFGVMVLALAAVGCATPPPASDEPALIERPNERSRDELRRVLAEAFNGRPVTIAEDALTRDDLLVIERSEPRGPEGSPAGGRVLERPEQFRLVLRDSHCELIRSSDQRRWTMTETSCVPKRGAGND
jgi:hypothetical protein